MVKKYPAGMRLQGFSPTRFALIGLVVGLLSACSPSPAPTLIPTITLLASSTPKLETPIPTETQIPTEAASPTSPPPTIPHLSDGSVVQLTRLEMQTHKSGWGIHQFENLMHTNDGGLTWQDVTPPELLDDNGAKSVEAFFYDANTAWVTFDYLEDFVVPNQPTVWFTSDAGNTWVAVGVLDTSQLQDEDYEILFMDFPTLNHGWILTYHGAGMSHNYVTLHFTDDGGQRWTQLINPSTDSSMQLCTKTAMTFSNANDGWITLDCFGVVDGAQVLQTSNSGAVWELLNIPLDDLKFRGNNDPYCRTHSPLDLDRELVVGLECIVTTGNHQTSEHFIAEYRDQTWSFSEYPGGKLMAFEETLGFVSKNIVYAIPPGKEEYSPLATLPDADGNYHILNFTTIWQIYESGLAVSNDAGVSWQNLAAIVTP